MHLLIVTPTLGNSAHMESVLASARVLFSEKTHILIHPGENNFPKAIAQENVLFLIEKENTRGLYDAINQAVVSVNREWTHFTYINDDDKLGDAFKFICESHMSLYADSFGYGSVSLLDEADKKLGGIPIEGNPRWFEALLDQGISPLNQQGMIIPRALWEKLGGFRTEYKLAADLDFWLRAHRMGWPFKYYPMEVGQFRIRKGQLSGDTQKLESEIAAVVARDAPRKIGTFEKFYACWQFRLKNLPIYLSRILSGRRVRGMQLLSGK